MKKPFFTTPLGSVVKVFLSAIIGHMMAKLFNKEDIFVFDIPTLKTYLAIGLGSTLPMIYNALNKNYPLYGAQPKTATVIDNETGQKIAP